MRAPPLWAVTAAGAAGDWGVNLDALARLRCVGPRRGGSEVGDFDSAGRDPWPPGWQDRWLREAWAGAPDRIGRMDRACRMALAAAWDCLGHRDRSGWDATRLGIAMGSRFGCLATNTAFEAELSTRGVRLASPLLFGYTVASAPAGEVGIAFGARGPLVAVSAGDASGLAALQAACRWIRYGRAERVLVGAYESMTAVQAELEQRAAPPGVGRVCDAAVFLLVERWQPDWTGPILGPVSLGFDPDAPDLPAPAVHPPAEGWAASAAPLLDLALAWREARPIRVLVRGGRHRGQVELRDPGRPADPPTAHVPTPGLS